jgi:hypothetical protein
MVWALCNCAIKMWTFSDQVCSFSTAHDKQLWSSEFYLYFKNNICTHTTEPNRSVLSLLCSSDFQTSVYIITTWWGKIVYSSLCWISLLNKLVSGFLHWEPERLFSLSVSLWPSVSHCYLLFVFVVLGFELIDLSLLPLEACLHPIFAFSYFSNRVSHFLSRQAWDQNPPTYSST